MVGRISQRASLLELTSDALCLAVTTALRLTSGGVTPSEAVQLLPVISLDQVSWHDNEQDCWIVIYDRVYDVTAFLSQHPGGAEIIGEHAGRDATLAFRGSAHSSHAWRAMSKYVIGELPPHERLFKSGTEHLFENTSYAIGSSTAAGTTPAVSATS